MRKKQLDEFNKNNIRISGIPEEQMKRFVDELRAKQIRERISHCLGVFSQKSKRPEEF